MDSILEKRRWTQFYDPDVPAVVRHPRFPISELLRNAADLNPNKAAVWFYSREITFWELYKTVNQFANALLNLGVKKGERVGLLLPNCPQFVIAFQAVVTIGAIVTNMNPMYTVEELKFIVNNTGLTTLITSEGAIENIKILTAMVDIPRVIVTCIADYMPNTMTSTALSLDLNAGWHHFSELLATTESTVKPRVSIDIHNDPAVIQFTGGTTGIPKGAVLSHKNVVAAISASFAWGTTLLNQVPVERRTALCLIPYCHIYGQLSAMGWSIITGATQIILPRFDINEVMDIIGKFKEITYFPTVPTMLGAIVNHPKAQEMDLGRKFILIGNGGAPCPDELVKKLWDMDIYYQNGYGMSETTGQASSEPNLGPKKLGSVGVPFPDVDLKVINPQTGEELPQGEVGEIVLTGPFNMMGYWNDPAATAQQVRDGWVYSGDLGYLDEDGYIFLVDRTKDMIIAGGYNIYPAEVDNILASYSKIQDAMCVGIPHEYRGETLKAFIVLKTGETATKEEIIAFCRQKLAAYKVPQSVEFCDAVPRTAIGKPLRRILREEVMKNK